MRPIANGAVAGLVADWGHLVHLLEKPLQGFGDAPSPNRAHQHGALTATGVRGCCDAVIESVGRDLVLEQYLDDIRARLCSRTALLRF
jgi:hypothetical protein